MNQGFVCVAAGTPKTTVADPKANREEIERLIGEMAEKRAKIMVLPELCLTGYECRDLFWQQKLIDSAKEELLALAEDTKGVDALIFVGLPFEAKGKLYNVAAALNHGRVLGLVPKTNLPNYNEFYEMRNFEPASGGVTSVMLGENEVPFGTDILFRAEGMPHLTVAAEICEDLWVPAPPSLRHTLAGATVVVNLSASDELVGKDTYRRQLVSSHSASCICGYVYASAGDGESTTDLVFGGHNIIAENGSILKEAKRFQNETIYSDLDVDRIVSERRRMTSFPAQSSEGYTVVPFAVRREETELIRAPDDSGDGPQEETRAHTLPLGGRRHLRRSRLDACASCDGARVRYAWDSEGEYPVGHNAVLRDDRPDIQQRLRAHEDARRDAEGGQYQEGGHAAF